MASAGVAGCEWQAIMFGGRRPTMFGSRGPSMFGCWRPAGGRSAIGGNWSVSGWSVVGQWLVSGWWVVFRGQWLVVGGWRLAVGGWRLAVGGWWVGGVHSLTAHLRTGSAERILRAFHVFFGLRLARQPKWPLCGILRKSCDIHIQE